MKNEPSRQNPVVADAILEHLDAAYNFARWLTRNDSDAQDIVQEACLRALRFGGRFAGDSARSWLLTIVRNTFYSSLRRNNPAREAVEFEEGAHADLVEENPEARALKNADAAMLNRAMEELPVAYREVLILREFEDLSYREIARITGVPAGTVMSRLARAREHLARVLKQRLGAAA